MLYADPTDVSAQTARLANPKTTTARVATFGSTTAIPYGNAGPLPPRLAVAEAELAAAAAHGADIVVFPEEFFSVCPNATGNSEQPTPDTPACQATRAQVISWCANQSKTLRLWTVCTMVNHFTDEGSGERREANEAIVHDRNGTLVGTYEKMWPVWEPAGGFNEMRMPSQKGSMVFDTDFGLRFCVVICNDLMFDESWQSCAALGADLVFFPSAWAGGTHLAARAHIHNFNVVNAPGPYSQGGCQPSGGGSCAYDNTGGVIADGTDGVVFADDHVRVLAIETERVVVWANFAGALSKLMATPAAACLATEPAGHMQQVSEYMVVRPSNASAASGVPCRVREILRSAHIPTLPEMKRWMRRGLNGLRASGQAGYPGAQPAFPDNPPPSS